MFEFPQCKGYCVHVHGQNTQHALTELLYLNINNLKRFSI